MGAAPVSPSVPRVSMRGISKRFEDVIALDDVDLDLAVGEVHALLGENGAGKTTLMNVLSGLYRADSGDITVDGRPASIRQPRDALALRIAMVHQHFELIQNFTALENIILGQEGTGLTIDARGQEARVRELSARYGLAVDLRAKVKELAIGIQQKVEILKALYRGAAVLILDEPTTMLTLQEVDNLFATIRSLVDNGLTVVLITHKIHEVLAISDRVTVMRRGQIVRTVPTRAATQDQLVSLMMGAGASAGGSTTGEARSAAAGTQPLLEVRNLTVPGLHGLTATNDATFQICAGQIVGLVGVAGNGQRELAEAIAGLRQAATGTIVLDGVDLTAAPIRDRMAAGIALVPEDRIGQGILPHLSLAETLVLGPHYFLYARDRLFDIGKARSCADAAIAEFNIMAPSARIATSKLSGGNIQKVVLARAFLMERLVGVRLLIAFNPTRGLDIMTTRFVHGKLRSLRAAGKSVLLISEDLDEALTLCDRLVVMRSGRIVGAFEREDFDRYAIGALMVGREAA